MRITLLHAFPALILMTRFATAAEPAVPDLLRQAQEAFNRRETNAALQHAEKAVALAPKDAGAHFTKGRILEGMGDLAAALKAFEKTIELAPNFAGGYQYRGTTHFKLGKMKEAIADFDQVIRLNPQQEPHHWQRGIAHYYAGRFADGKRQFEIHQTVNSADVENAVWHFLCNARLSGAGQARKELIQVGPDARVPMKEVFALFAGKGTAQQVFDAAEAGDAPAAERRNRRFYAHLYLGLYYEATGDAKKAREHITKAATDYSEPHYMGDVARVHLQLLKEKK